MKDVMKIALRLIIITLIAGLLLGLTYAVTKDAIANQEKIAAQAAREKVLASADSFEIMDIASKATDKYEAIKEVYIGKDAQGEDAGATVNLIVNGFNPNLNITVGISKEGVIEGVEIGSLEETPGLGAKAQDDSFLSQFKGKGDLLSVVKTAPAKDTDVQAITGATITSKAVTNAVNTAREFFSEYVKGGK